MMLKTRNQGDDSMFRWARTEMKREIVMSQSSYAKIAGLQSEVGRVVITRVAGSELEYKRKVNMYRNDMTCAVNNIRREQVKMRLKMGRYTKKLKQTKIENTKRLKEEQRRDGERAQLEELHLRLKFEAAAKTPEPGKNIDEVEHDDVAISPSVIDFKDVPFYIKTGVVHEPEENFWRNPEGGDDREHTHNAKNKQANKPRNENRHFSPLPMIDEVAEKENEEETDKLNASHTSVLNLDMDKVEMKQVDEELSVSSYGARRRKKKEVSFSDIMKLKYTGTKHLFDLVNILAKKHGIPDVPAEKVPDPRDNIVHRGATNDSDSLRLHAAVLYPMKYGYEQDSDVKEFVESDSILSNNKSPTGATNDVEIEKHLRDETEELGEKPTRKLSLEQRRVIFLSGVHSKSVDGIGVYPEILTESPRKLVSRDNSMNSLVEKFAKIKLEQKERMSKQRRNSVELTTHLPSTSKPSSSRSSRSLPTLSRHSAKSEDKVSWAEAFGLLRAVHSLEDVS